MEINKIYNMDCIEGLKTLPDGCVNAFVTSPPYWGLRDYGVEGQIGLEETLEEYICKLVMVFREAWRVLRDDGTLWLNLGDCYAKSGVSGMGDPTIGERNLGGATPIKKHVPDGLKPKDLIGIPWRVAFALQADGWYLRSDIVWHKPNPVPESVTDRPTKSHEYIFLLSKSPKYYYDAEAIKEAAVYDGRIVSCGPNSRADVQHVPGNTKKQDLTGNRRYTGFNERWANRPVRGRNKRSVWTVATKPFEGAHFATFPPELIRPCILAGCPVGGVTGDMFMGAGTTAVTAFELGRNYIGFELNPDYCKIADDRIAEAQRRKESLGTPLFV